MSDDTVCVALRIRPLIQSEIDKHCQTCLNVIPGEPQVRINNSDKSFTYNYVFSPDVGQEEFYNIAVKRLLHNTFQGYNVTILAYGQTGSGKTYSMGTNYMGEGEKGVIPRIIDDIFQTIELKKEDWNFTVTASFIELYQEQLYDLLSNKQRSQSVVDIREDGKNIKIVGITEKDVANAQETLQCLIQGSLGRVTGATAMNAHSSRSHAIFTICIQQQKKDDANTATVAKFHLVDLAGSERSKKTQATGERFKEGVNINKGLLALGNVISQLGDGPSGSYIGYRDSKLTRLLQDSLGGNSMTLMIACVSPADYNLDETLSTLRYADRARKIKNKPIVNQDPKIAEINRLNKLVQELRSGLANQDEFGLTCPKEHKELEEKCIKLQQKLRDITETLNSNLVETVIMHERFEIAEQAWDRMRSSIALLVDKYKHLLLEFSSVQSEIGKEMCNKLQPIYEILLNIQNDAKTTCEELIHHEISNSNSSINTLESSGNTEEVIINDSLDYFDKKEEEHTLRQTERNNEVHNINKQLALKESLVAELIKNATQLTAESHTLKILELEQEIKRLNAEKEDHLQVIRSQNVSSKLAEMRRKKLQECEKTIAELTRKHVETTKIMKTKEKQDLKIKTLSSEIQSLKETRVKLIRQMRIDANNFTKWKQSKEKEINKLKSQDRKRATEMVRMKIAYNKQENVFKRKMEEAFAANKRLKSALEMQKRAIDRQEKKANSKDEIKLWMAQEMEVRMAVADAHYSLEKLKQDRASLVTQLEQLKQSSNPNEEELFSLSEFVELRNTQIADLQQKILESEQENKANNRWNIVRTTTDAKVALETACHIFVEDKKQQRYKNEGLKENLENLQMQLEEARKREKELNDKCQNLEQQVEQYKWKVNRQILTENNSDKGNKKSISKKRSREENEVDEILLHDESFTIEDDVDNDPDWTKTPIYNRLRKAQHKSKILVKRLTYSRSLELDKIKCACKTKCITKICVCRKHDTMCTDCNCNPEQCQNKNNLSTPLFSDIKTDVQLEKENE